MERAFIIQEKEWNIMGDIKRVLRDLGKEKEIKDRLKEARCIMAFCLIVRGIF